LLEKRPKLDLPLKRPAKASGPPAAESAAPSAAAAGLQASGPLTTQCTVEEGGKRRTFTITLEPIGGGNGGGAALSSASGGTPAPAPGTGTARQVFSTFAGAVEVVDIVVRPGQRIEEGAVVAAVEAMKARHDIRSPHAGTVTEIHVKVGDEVDAGRPIVTVA
jgi:biotin carboxyl carrier protein